MSLTINLTYENTQMFHRSTKFPRVHYMNHSSSNMLFLHLRYKRSAV